MLKGYALLLLAFAFRPVCATAIRRTGAAFTHVASFGDSISDNGRALLLLKQNNISYRPDPAYYMGRFSNGPVWVEDLAAAYGAPLSGYAVGGSTSNNSHVYCPPFPGTLKNAPSADEQVAEFLANSSDPARQNMGTTLFTIWTGTNDIQYAPYVQPPGTVSTIRNLIKELRAAGGKSFLIVDLYDLSKTPLAGKDYYLSASYAYVGLVLDPILGRFSAGMRTDVSALAQEAGVAYFSAYDLFKTYQCEPATYGFEPSKNQTACLKPAGLLNARSECTNPNQYIFWDTLHPTRETHQLIGQKTKQIVDSYYG